MIPGRVATKKTGISFINGKVSDGNKIWTRQIFRLADVQKQGTASPCWAHSFDSSNECNKTAKWSCRGTPILRSLTFRTKDSHTFLLQRMAHAVPCFWTGSSGRKSTSTAVVSTKNLPVNQQNNANKKPTSRLKSAEICSTFRPHLVFSSAVYSFTSPFERLRNQPHFNTFSAEMEMWEGDLEGNVVHLKVPGADVKADGGVVWA